MSWDVDGNGSLDALTDGRLVLSYLFGFTGEALIRNSLAPDATRTQAAEIITYLESIRDQFDVDGNGRIDALTDGSLYLRYLFGFTGEALTRGAVGAGATRANASQIIGYVESITDDGGNQAPIAVDDLAFTQESSSVTIAVLDNDLDPDGDAIAIAGVSTPAAGTISIDGDELEYSPADGFTGTDSFSYTIDDGQLTDTATVTVTVEGANAPPGAADDLAFTQVNSPVTIFVLDNDFPDGFVGLVDFDSSSAVGGRIARDNNDSPFDTTDDFLIYTPAFGFIGTDSFTYTISDGNGDTDTAEVTVTVSDSVTPSNNDNFANAQEISGVPTTSTSQNVDATKEVGEPNHAGNDGGSSVWWSWTAPENGSVTITTVGSDFDTVLGVYTGNSLSSLTEIASNDDSEGLTSSVTFDAVAGTDYKIAVDGFDGAIGNINLNIESASASNNPPIAADDLAFTQVNSPVTIFVLDNDFPDGSVGLVDFDSSSAVGGRIARDNNDSPFDTTDDFLIYTPAFGFIGTDSFTYTISDGNGDTDTAEVTVTVSDSVTPSNNDNFANAQEISGVPTTSTSQNILATLEEGEPNHAGNAGGSSVWWSWTAPENGSVTITTGGSDFDTVLGVYTGNSLSSLTEIASNDDSGEGLTSSVTFNAVAGEDYKIAVDGFGGAIGNINLNIESASASNNSPIAVDDLAFTQVNSSVTIAVLDNDFPDGEVELVGFGSFSVEDGTIALNNNDSPFDPTDDFLIYTPAFDFVGVDSFSYTITDAQGLTDTATVNVTVESSPNNSGNTQIITPVPSTQLASVNEAISIDVQYSTDPANSPTAGIAFRLHWDSTKLSFDGVDNILADDFISEGLPVEDTDNSDNDPTTDRLISVSWVDLLGGSWPNNPSSLPISLYTANFTTASDFADSTTVNFSLGSGSTSAGFDFSSTSATIGFG